MPASGRMQTECGIAEEWDGDAQHGVDLVYCDTFLRGGYLGQIDARLTRNLACIEAMHLQQAPEHLPHRGKSRITRLIAGPSDSDGFLHLDSPLLARAVNDLARQGQQMVVGKRILH